MPATPEATPAKTATPQKPFHKRLLTAAFAIAVGALAIDDLRLRVENFAVEAVAEALVEENEAMRQNQQNDSGNGPFIVQPGKDRTYEITLPSRKAAPRPSI